MAKQGSESVATKKEKRGRVGKGGISSKKKGRMGKGRSYTSAIAIFTTLTG
jgi:hypothetical protein